MYDFKMAIMMLNRIKPKPLDKKWVDANLLLKELNKKTIKFRDEKERKFVVLVDAIFKELEDGNK